MSEQRLLEDLLAFLGFFETHYGREASLHDFLDRGGRSAIADLNLSLQQRAARIQHVERLGAKRAGPSFQTVLFGDVAAAMFQPLVSDKEFAQHNTDIMQSWLETWVPRCLSAARTLQPLWSQPDAKPPRFEDGLDRAKSRFGGILADLGLRIPKELNQ